jgi:hypothetical protein
MAEYEIYALKYAGPLIAAVLAQIPLSVAS